MEKSSGLPSLNDFCNRSSKSNGEEEEEEEKHLECNICFQSPKEAVVSFCGHLFCWPCLYTWLHFYSLAHQCPACKSPIHHQKLIPVCATAGGSSHSIPIYISGTEIPSRPTRQRSEISPPCRSGANIFNGSQLRLIAREFPRWIDNLIIILLCGVLLLALIVLQSSSFQMQCYLFLFVLCTLVAIEFRVAG